MPLPMTKAVELFQRYASRLGDPVSGLGEFELHRAAREIQDALRGAPDAASAGALWTLLANVRSNLGRDDEALDAARNAVRATPTSAVALLALGVMLGRMGRDHEAVAQFAEARRHARPDLIRTVLCNLAAAHFNLGQRDEGEEVLAEAVHGPPPEDPTDVLRTAIAAAAMELDEDAVMLLARYAARVQGVPRGDAPALAVLDAAPVELRAQVLAHPFLRRAVETVRARERAAPPDELGFRTRIELPPEAWARLRELTGA